MCTGLSPRVTDDWLKHYRKIQKKVTKLNLEHPDLAGDGTIFGLMPDWNPAEIIGVKPKPLALSLYRELVTDSIWARQRLIMVIVTFEAFLYWYRSWVTRISMSGSASTRLFPMTSATTATKLSIIISNNSDMNLRTTTGRVPDSLHLRVPRIHTTS